VSTVALVQTIAPELTDTSQIEAFLALAAARMSAPVWGAVYGQGVAYLTAHLITLTSQGAGGATGPVSSRRALQLAESYAVAATGGADDGLRRTSYGVTFLTLRNSLAATAPRFVGV
jgi:hypothetical protein